VIFTYLYLRDGRLRSFLIICVSTILGCYTVPTYVFFGAPLMATLLAVRFRRDLFVAASVSAVVTLLLYLPIAGQVISSFQHYSETLDATFGSFGGFREFFFISVFPRWIDPPIALTVLGAIILGVALLWRDKISFQFALCVFAACFVFFAYCVWQKTIPMRTVAFIAVAVNLLLAFLIQKNLFERLPDGTIRLGVEVVASLLLIGNIGQHFETDRPIPLENWSAAKQAAEFLEGVNGEVRFDESAKNFLHIADHRTPVGLIKEDAPYKGISVSAARSWRDDEVRLQKSTNPQREYIFMPGELRDVILHFPISNQTDLVLPVTYSLEKPRIVLKNEFKLHSDTIPYVAGFHFSDDNARFLKVEKWNGQKWVTPPSSMILAVGDSILVRSPKENSVSRIRFISTKKSGPVSLQRVWVYEKEGQGVSNKTKQFTLIQARPDPRI
jgi:hypothetical protein